MLLEAISPGLATPSLEATSGANNMITFITDMWGSHETDVLTPRVANAWRGKAQGLKC